ncbi:SRPBCC family protein [Flavobacterium sp.]|uniref:SRPBCC family protein n=1 Tax=Flavobacterium sp. TaxID=239 RepID=UPI002B4AD6BB|nr:SRPBCC family protein [Flavobacterium sp.]HLP64986.1 SRPBCC family protein [Flavobacterium sp.]
MTSIHLITRIKAPVQDVFDAARNIDLHQNSAYQTHEKAIAGKTSGWIELGETVTFKGKHFGIYLTHTSKIIKMEKPHFFVDKMIEGKFKSFKHLHFFEEKEGVTIMTDILEYETPFGFFGKLFDRLLLKNHLEKFLLERNQILKENTEI